MATTTSIRLEKTARLTAGCQRQFKEFDMCSKKRRQKHSVRPFSATRDISLCLLSLEMSVFPDQKRWKACQCCFIIKWQVTLNTEYFDTRASLPNTMDASPIPVRRMGKYAMNMFIRISFERQVIVSKKLLLKTINSMKMNETVVVKWSVLVKKRMRVSTI